MKKILSAFVVVMVSALAQSAPSVSLSVPKGWIEDVAKARAKAALQGKFVLMAFSGSDWCGWCVRMEKEVFSQQEFVGKASQKYVLVMIDIPRDKSKLSDLAASQNQEIARQYRIGGYPSVVITDAKGEEVSRHSGYVRGGPKAFLERLDKLTAGVKRPSLGMGAYPLGQSDLAPLLVCRAGECTGELEVDVNLEVSRRPVKTLNAKNCDMEAVRALLDRMAAEINAMTAGTGGSPATHLKALDALFGQYAKEAKLSKEEMLEAQIRLLFRLCKGVQSPDVRKAAETKQAELMRRAKSAEDYIASEELRLMPDGLPLDGMFQWEAPKKLSAAVSEGCLSDKGLRSAQREVLKTVRKMQIAKGAAANAVTMLAACETSEEAKKRLSELDGAFSSYEKQRTAALGRFAYSADEKAAAKVGILKDHIDLLKAIAEQIGNEAAAQVNARISELEAMAGAMDKDRHSNRQPRKP